MGTKHRKPVLTAATADKHRLYEIAVQCPEAEIDFVTSRFKSLRGRPLRRLCEDFCGTSAAACEFVKRHADNYAEGLDLHAPTLAWARRHNVANLSPEQQRRIELIRRNVLHPRGADKSFDAVVAMNFSYWIFKTRETLRTYFGAVRAALASDGVFFLDTWGGYESMKEQRERRRCVGGFTYVWDQARYDPISGDLTCYIHFDFPRGPVMERAFVYDWRLWTLPELRELLTEAGFRKVTVYWEGEDEKGHGNSVFSPRKRGVADASFICYIGAEK
ncbi:hypothetical protein PHYC_01828 [Phycisphaerales bacterium]|nr:hypothetical protein PHYC_01828 [Phycisphaerales bacterium]